MFRALGLGLGLFVGSLAFGWWLGRRGHLTDELAAGVIRFVIRWLSPVVLGLSFWRLELSGGRLFVLPLIGGVVSLSALLPAWGYARAARLSRPQIGSFLTCAMFSNLGFLGAFIAFAIHGEVAYGLAMFYLVFFSPYFYTIGLTLATRYGHPATAAAPRPAFGGELRAYPFVGMALGVLLSAWQVPRPEILRTLNSLLIPVDTALYVMAIGSQLTIRPVSLWKQPCAAMSAIKFVYNPLVSWLLVMACGLSGLERFVVLLQGAMPVAISPLMLPMLFGLDRRLSNALWLSTTLLCLPWLLVYLPLIHG